MTTSKRTTSTKKLAIKKAPTKKAVVKKATKATPRTKIDPEVELAHFCVEAALDKKAENPVILDLRGISTFTDFFVIVSASSEPQIKAIASCVRDRMRSEKGISPHADDAYPGSRWIVVDFGNILVHIFHQELREVYDLEALWNDAEKIKIKKTIAAKEPKERKKSKIKK